MGDLIRVALCLAGVLVAIAGAGARQSEAQATFEGCRDALGRPVASVAQPGIGDFARALLGPGGQPIILYDPSVLPWVSRPFRQWMYAHECAHHALGHSIGRAFPLTMEQEADCWGIQALQKSGRLRESDLRAIQSDLARLGRGDWTHLPGPQRAINLVACLGEEGGDDQGDCEDRCFEAWDRCTDRCRSTSCTERCERTEERCKARCARPRR